MMDNKMKPPDYSSYWSSPIYMITTYSRANKRSHNIFRGKRSIKWDLHAKAILPLILWIGLLLNLLVVSEDQNQSLKTTKNRNISVPINNDIKPVSLISSHENPIHPMMSIVFPRLNMLIYYFFTTHRTSNISV